MVRATLEGLKSLKNAEAVAALRGKTVQEILGLSLIHICSALKALEGDPEYEKKIVELMDEVDRYIQTPERPTDKPFLMPVEDVFTITGRGTVATGRIERGVAHVGDAVEIVGMKDEKKSTCLLYTSILQSIGEGTAKYRFGYPRAG